MNDEMDRFHAKTQVPPTIYGVLFREMRTPSRRGKATPKFDDSNDHHEGRPSLSLILGTPGGSRIITTVLQTILNVVDFQMNIQEAVDAPRIQNQWLPDVTKYRSATLFRLTPAEYWRAWGIGSRIRRPTKSRSGDHCRWAKLGGTAIGRNRFYGAKRSAWRHRTGARLLGPFGGLKVLSLRV